MGVHILNVMNGMAPSGPAPRDVEYRVKMMDGNGNVYFHHVMARDGGDAHYIAEGETGDSAVGPATEADS